MTQDIERQGQLGDAHKSRTQNIVKPNKLPYMDTDNLPEKDT